MEVQEGLGAPIEYPARPLPQSARRADLRQEWLELVEGGLAGVLHVRSCPAGRRRSAPSRRLPRPVAAVSLYGVEVEGADAPGAAEPGAADVSGAAPGSAGAGEVLGAGVSPGDAGAGCSLVSGVAGAGVCGVVAFGSVAPGVAIPGELALAFTLLDPAEAAFREAIANSDSPALSTAGLGRVAARRGDTATARAVLDQRQNQ